MRGGAVDQDHVVIVMSDPPQFQCQRCHSSQVTPPVEKIIEFWEASDVFLEKHVLCDQAP